MIESVFRVLVNNVTLGVESENLNNSQVTSQQERVKKKPRTSRALLNAAILFVKTINEHVGMGRGEGLDSQNGKKEQSSTLEETVRVELQIVKDRTDLQTEGNENRE